MWRPVFELVDDPPPFDAPGDPNRLGLAQASEPPEDDEAHHPRGVLLCVRFADLHAVTRSVTLPAAVSVTPILAEIAESLVRTALADHPEEKQITLLAISVSQLVYEAALQLELPFDLEGVMRPGTEQGASRWALDKAVDEVRERFGRTSVGYASVELTEGGTVPDELRELAEH